MADKIDRWIVENAPWLKSGVRVLFGFAWLLDGAYKYQPGMSSTFVTMINQSITMHPAILAPWATFWYNQVVTAPGFYVSMIATLEVVLGLALIFGFMRKIAYAGGILLSLFVWCIGEGYGGIFMAGATDVGAAVMYVYVFLLLLLVEATYGTSRYSLDYYIEKRAKWWKTLAEVKY